MAPILSPQEISFLFPLLKKSYFALVFSKELCIKAGHMGVAVWTSSGFVTEVVSDKFTNWVLWWWLGWRFSKIRMSKVISEFIFLKSLKATWPGCFGDKRDFSLRCIHHLYNWKCRASTLKEWGPPCHHLTLKVQKVPKGFPWHFKWHNIWFRCVYATNEALVCEVTLTSSEWI